MPSLKANGANPVYRRSSHGTGRGGAQPAAASARGDARGRILGRWLLPALLAVDTALLVNHAVWTLLLGRIPDLFNLDREANIPTWWSSNQLLVAGLLLAWVAFSAPSSSRSARGSLGPIALLVIGMSLDETVGLHERGGTLLDSYLGGKEGTILSHTGYWPLFLGIPAVLGVGAILWRSASVLAQLGGSVVRLLAAFAVFFGGAVGVELLNNIGGDGLGSMEMLEEYLEMVGGSLLVWSAWDLLQRGPRLAGIRRRRSSTTANHSHLRPSHQASSPQWPRPAGD